MLRVPDGRVGCARGTSSRVGYVNNHQRACWQCLLAVGVIWQGFWVGGNHK